LHGPGQEPGGIAGQLELGPGRPRVDLAAQVVNALGDGLRGEFPEGLLEGVFLEVEEERRDQPLEHLHFLGRLERRACEHPQHPGLGSELGEEMLLKRAPGFGVALKDKRQLPGLGEMVVQEAQGLYGLQLGGKQVEHLGIKPAFGFNDPTASDENGQHRGDQNQGTAHHGAGDEAGELHGTRPVCRRTFPGTTPLPPGAPGSRI
jgi:hypothetical protein